jgi:hypothetical protein
MDFLYILNVGLLSVFVMARSRKFMLLLTSVFLKGNLIFGVVC